MTGPILMTAMLVGAPAVKGPPPKDPPVAGTWRLEAVTVGGVPVPNEVDEKMSAEFGARRPFTDRHAARVVARRTIQTCCRCPPDGDRLAYTEGRLTLGHRPRRRNSLTLCQGQGPGSPRPKGSRPSRLERHAVRVQTSPRCKTTRPAGRSFSQNLTMQYSALKASFSLIFFPSSYVRPE